MRIGYLECFSGISGDMLLGALVDAGVPFELLKDTTAALNVGAHLEMRKVSRGGLAGTKVDVMVHGDDAALHDHTHDPVEHSHVHSHHEPAHSHPHSHEHDSAPAHTHENTHADGTVHSHLREHS